jgi:hypothetical protein
VVHASGRAADIEAAIVADLEKIGSPDINFNYVIDESGSVPMAIATANYDVPLRVPFLPDLALHFRRRAWRLRHRVRERTLSSPAAMSADCRPSRQF